MARSTFNRHKNAIEDIFGIYIDCDRTDGYRYYYIGNAIALTISMERLSLTLMTLTGCNLL